MKKIIFSALALALVCLCSCSDDDGKASGRAYETITLKNGIYNNAGTRAVSQTLQEYKFDAGRQVGVFVSGAGTESGYGYSNVQLTTDGKEGFTGATLLYPTEGSVVINSYAPYNADYTLGETQIFTVSADQSNDEDYIASDLLYAEETADKYDETVTVKYYHELEKIDINIHGDIEEILGDTLTLLNLTTSARFDPSTGAIEAVSGSEADIITAEYGNEADGAEYLTSSTIVVPQNLSNLTVTIGKYTYTCSTDVDGEGGTRYSFNCTVEKGKYIGILDYDGIINNWTDEGDEEEEEEENEETGDYVFDLGSIDPTIWGDGTYNALTQTLATGDYGFGGWQFAGGLDLSAYNYLVIEVESGTDLSGAVRFRMFDEDNYWSTPANFNITSTTTVIDLNNQQVDDPDNEGYAPVDPSHIYIAGFWTFGPDYPVIIKKIYATNTLPETEDEEENEEESDGTSADDYEFSLSSLDATIWGDGTFDTSTGTLVTGEYGFGGWHFGSGLDLSAYNYLVLDLAEGTNISGDGGVVFRLYPENNYWISDSEVAMFDVDACKMVIDLNNMSAQTSASGASSIDPSAIYYAGFWTYGGEDNKVVINRIYATNTYPDI